MALVLLSAPSTLLCRGFQTYSAGTTGSKASIFTCPKFWTGGKPLHSVPKRQLKLWHAHKLGTAANGRMSITHAAADVTLERPKEKEKSGRSPLLEADVPQFVKDAVKDQPWRGLLEPSPERLEIVDPSRVKGKIPEDLKGVYYRLGPGNTRIGDRKQGHWFDGDGMIYAFTFNGPDEPVRFQSRWVDTPRIRQRLEAAQKNKVSGKGVWTPADGGPLANVGSIENPSNTAPNFVNGKLLALAEGGAPVELDPRTLDTRGKVLDYVGDSPFSAHPKVDPETGIMYNHGVVPEVSPTLMGLRLFKIAPDGTLLKKTRVSLDGPTFVHDLLISENYVATFIPPWASTTPDLIQFGLGIGNFGNSYKWYPERGTRAVIARKSDLEVVADVSLPPFSMYHNANAYEEDGKLHLVTCRQNGKRADLEAVMGDLWTHTFRWETLCTLWKYTFDTKTWQLESDGPAVKQADGTVTATHGHDFPTVNPAYVGKKMRYVYVLANASCGRLKAPVAGEGYVGAAKVPGSEAPGARTFYNSLEKYDLETGEAKEFDVGGGSSDAVFVPKKGGQAEDDGYLVAVVYNDDRHTSSVVVVDAGSMEFVCEVELPVYVTSTFHGCWMPESG